MSTHNGTLAHGDHDHDHDHHDHHDDHDEGASHSTFKGYMTGFILSVILTAIPFWVVMDKVFDQSSTTAMVVLGLAAVQIVVHMIYFLHMNARSEGGWNMLALIFTIVIVVITLAGSLWVMYHLNVNMMPSMTEMKNMP
ncbi:MAG TPA: cytochrome o ubiquinol oxidase subunit IV [Bordetella sp.]|nr:cytochrome o ubiquinol oxidase subunit IV [Bordetella sp.]